MFVPHAGQRSAQTQEKACFHGGAVYDFIGDDFRALSRIDDIIGADVLDAWFDPSPRALDALRERLPFALRTSPPVAPTGLERVLSGLTGVATRHLLCGAGSSDLIFLALRELLNQKSRVLILDPTYGEYAHVLKEVIGCGFQSFDLQGEDGYKVDVGKLVDMINQKAFDLVILVNPNNPSGKLIPRGLLEKAIEQIPTTTRVWIDEAYIDYASALYDAGSQSLCEYAAKKPNVIVCKSLSKVLALSGLRVAYLCADSNLIAHLKELTPPWSLSLPAQLLAIEALQDERYYKWCYARTHALRNELCLELMQLGFKPLESVANFVLVEYERSLPEAKAFIAQCAKRKLLVRNIASMGKRTLSHSFRIAVKDQETNERMCEILSEVLCEVGGTGT